MRRIWSVMWNLARTIVADSPLEERGFELLVPSAISSWIGWVPEPLFGRIRALGPGYGELGCRTVSLDNGRGIRRGKGAAVDRSVSGSAGHSLRCSGVYASKGGVAEAANVTGWWPAHGDREG